MATQPSGLSTTPPHTALPEIVENVDNDSTTSHYVYFGTNFLLPWTAKKFLSLISHVRRHFGDLF